MSRLYRVVVDYASLIPRIAEPEELGDVVKWLAVLHALQVQAQALIDMVARLASLLGYAPSTPVEAIEILRAEGVLGEEEARLLRSVVGFRNIVVHEYLAVDRGIVREILARREYMRLVELARKLLDEAQRRGFDP